MRYFKVFSLLIFLIIGSCQSPKNDNWVHKTHEYVNPVDTKTKPIERQALKTFVVGSVSASNNFAGARLNNFIKLNDTTFQATISPENTPINPSPWYAFKIWSEKNQTINLRLHYTEHKHRYHPKLSSDGENWTALDSSAISLDSIDATLKLNIGQDTLWVAAQEIHDSKRVADWLKSLENNSVVSLGKAGQSPLEKPLHFMNISKGANKDKPAIVILSRQHPPEVTGYLAMQSFVKTIIEQGVTNGFLERYRVLVYPLLNPDGVDLGHFRHNTGGVDLNRDWSKYNQSEILQITKHIVNEVATHQNEVLLGLDFHSTYKDIYYIPAETVERKVPDFTQTWLDDIKVGLNLDTVRRQASEHPTPVSSAWFNKQFGATGITYEIGDHTPRDFIKVKGRVSAEAMMAYLLKN